MRHYILLVLKTYIFISLKNTFNQFDRLKDGKPLSIDGKHIKQIELDDGTVLLQIDEATDADAGNYSCVASNEDGDNTSSAPLDVLGKCTG